MSAHTSMATTVAAQASVDSAWGSTKRHVQQGAEVVERVVRVARRVNQAYGMGEDEGGETTMEGLLGYCEAASRHDGSRGTELWAYAFARVRGRMLEHVRRVARNGKRMPAWLRYDEAEWEAEDVRGAAYVNPSLAACDAGGNRETDHSMESCMAERHMALLVARILAELPEAHRYVVMELLVQQRRLVDVSRELGKPHWRVRSMLRRAIREMRAAVMREGYTYRGLFGG